MKNFLLTIVFCLSFAYSAFAQYSLTSAKGNSSIIVKKGKSYINYDVSETRLGVGLIYTKVGPTIVDKNGNPIVPDLTQVDFDFGISTFKGKRDLFKGGEFTPGADFGLTVSHVFERRNKTGYDVIFGRVKFDIAERKVVNINQDQPGLLELDSKTGLSIGFGLGYNHAFNENFILGISGVVAYDWNSTEGLKESRVCVNKLTGVDSLGNEVTVSECSDRFLEELPDQLIGQARMDLFWNITTLGDSKAATLGLIGAISMNYSRYVDKVSYNISLGPSIQPPNKPNQVVFATLFEVIDISNNLDTAPEFINRFRIRLYIGIPFSFLK